MLLHKKLYAGQVVEDPVPVPGAAEASAEFRNFVAQCMAKDPFRRPTAEGLLSHPFILKVCSVIKGGSVCACVCS
jgi:serine/threonine protein kinase